MTKLNLKRPLAFFDLETTGVNVSIDRIVEISVLKILVDGSQEVKTLRINPEMPIPIESSLVHGIYNEDIKDAPTFKSIAQDLIDFIGNADLAGYNSNRFDIPLLMEEFLRVKANFDIENRYFIDVQNIFHQMEQRTLKAAYKFYCNKDIINAHSAEADIKATYEVLLAQIEKYEDIPFEDKKGHIYKPVKNDIEALHTFSNINKPVDFAGRMVYNDDNVAVFNFGKHKGKSVLQVFEEEPSYYSWMMNGDFPLYTKHCLGKLWWQFKNDKNVKKSSIPQNDNEKSDDKQNFKADKKLNNTELKNNSETKTQYNSTKEKFIKKEKNIPVNDDMLKMLANKFKNS